ncbi:MAG: purine-nucleoside phosphorylase [Oscillospiraceae bacterium]|nr:purine-nucleoside phosphorylase [Oscillospiraceae bacterium]
MTYTYEQYRQSAEYIKDRIGGKKPEILMILGSGLGFMGEIVEDPVYVPYADIPHFKHSTAPGHEGRFVIGTLGGKCVAVMQGRMHTYEGYSYEDVSYAVRVAHLLGVHTMIVTNAAGAVNKAFRTGEIMLITDHIKLFGESPLAGPNIEEFGTRFPDMSTLYTPQLQQVARESAAELGIRLNEGVYMFFPGPHFETPAEVRAARILGADNVGMSTVPEVITAGHCGMRVLGFSLSANPAAGVTSAPLLGEDVNATAEATRPVFSALVLKCLEKM